MPGTFAPPTTKDDAFVTPVTLLAVAKHGVESNLTVVAPDAVAAADNATVSVPSALTTMPGVGTPNTRMLERMVVPAGMLVPVTASPGANCVLPGTVINGLPNVVVVLILPLTTPVIFSARPTFVSDLMPNEVRLAATFGGQIEAGGPAAVDGQVYAVVFTLPTGAVDGVVPVAVGPPEVTACPIASPVTEATVIWVDPGVTRVAVTAGTRGWMRVNVAFAGKVEGPKAALKLTVFPEIDRIVV